MEIEEKIRKLQEFKKAVIEWDNAHQDQEMGEERERRTYICQNTNWIRQEVDHAQCFHTFTLPIGGLVAQDVDPFLTLFDPCYGINMVQEVIDMIDRTIGVLKNPFPEASQQNQKQPVIEKTAVFIVHGRDDLAKTETARFIENLGFKAIILHENASSGKTIIEKIEEYTNVGFAIVLYTPCDIGSLASESSQKPRARQNVVFEHGYLIGKLSRQKVCALVKGDVETPNDISGVVYIQLDGHGAWHVAIAKELRKAGYPVDMNKL